MSDIIKLEEFENKEEEPNSVELYIAKRKEEENWKYQEMVKSKILKANSKDFEILGNLSMFPDLRNLTIINLSHNLIYSLKGIEEIEGLTSLNLSFNKIEEIKELKRIKNKRNIVNLDVDFNPLTSHPNYRLILIDIFPCLQYLDSLEIDSTIEQSYKDVYLKLSQILIPFLTLLEMDTEIVEGLIEKIVDLKKNNIIQYKKPSLDSLLIEAYNNSESNDLPFKIKRPELNIEDIFKNYTELTRYAKMISRIDLEKKFKTPRREKFEINDRTKYMINLFKELVANIQLYTDCFKGVQFYSGIELTAMYEDLFRMMTLEFTNDNDYGLDNYLKKKLLRSYSPGDSESFVEQFNNDPIFAFDSLLESFYHIWPVNEEASKSKLGIDEEKYVINDLDSTREINRYVDEKLVKIKRGYSVEFASKYYDQIQNKESRVKDYRLKNKRQIKIYFPCFPFNNDYSRRLFNLVKEKIENFALAYLDLSDIAKEAELTDRSHNTPLNKGIRDIETVSEVDFRLTNTKEKPHNLDLSDLEKSLDSVQREEIRQKRRLTSSKKKFQEKIVFEELESGKYRNLEGHENIDLSHYDVENIQILDPMDNPDVQINLFQGEKFENLPPLSERFKKSLRPTNPYLELGGLPIVLEESENKKSVGERTPQSKKKEEVFNFDLSKEELEQKNFRFPNSHKLFNLLQKFVDYNKRDAFFVLKRISASHELVMMIKWLIYNRSNYECKRREYYKEIFEKLKINFLKKKSERKEIIIKNAKLDINKKWFVRRLYQKLNENYIKDIKHYFWILVCKTEMISGSDSKSIRLIRSRSINSRISSSRSQVKSKEKIKNEEYNFKRNFETFGSKKSTISDKINNKEKGGINREEVERKIGEKYENFNVNQKLRFSENGSKGKNDENWVGREIRHNKNFWEMTKEIPTEWKTSKKEEIIFSNNSPYSKLNEEFSDISDVYPSVITRKISEKKKERVNNTERAPYKSKRFNKNILLSGQNSVRIEPKESRNVFSPNKEFPKNTEKLSQKSEIGLRKLSQGFVTTETNKNYSLNQIKSQNSRKSSNIDLAIKGQKNTPKESMSELSKTSENVKNYNFELSPHEDYNRFEDFEVTSKISSINKNASGGVPRFSDYSGFNPKTSKYLYTPIYKKTNSQSLLEEKKTDDDNLTRRREQMVMEQEEMRKINETDSRSKGISLRSKQIDFTVRRTDYFSQREKNAEDFETGNFGGGTNETVKSKSNIKVEDNLTIKKDSVPKKMNKKSVSKKRNKSKSRVKIKKSIGNKRKKNASKLKRTPFKDIQNLKSPLRKIRRSSKSKNRRLKSKRKSKRATPRKITIETRRKSRSKSIKPIKKQSRSTTPKQTRFLNIKNENLKLENPFKSQRSNKTPVSGRRWSITRERSITRAQKVLQLTEKYRTNSNSRSKSKGKYKRKGRKRSMESVEEGNKVNLGRFVQNKCDGIKKFNEFMAGHKHTGPYCEACRLFMMGVSN